MKTEMEKLIDALESNGIPFDHVVDDNSYYNRNQVLIRKNGKPVLSVICQFGSYGYEKRLLEIMGDDFLTKEELKYDSVVGYLTAEEVMDRILKRKGELLCRNTSL